MSTIVTQTRALPARTFAADLLPAGALAGPWRIERELGRGGMGAVYAVTHDGIGKQAALKVVHRNLLTAEGSIERILLEARVVNQVRHPNIVDIFETGTLEDGRPYIVMERLEGAPLADRVANGKLRADEVISILLQICDALGAAHAAGIVHRDLKLDNVFVADDGAVKVIDWGIAKVVTTDFRQTLEGELVGTPQYLSPEQARGSAVTPQTDVYSLGVVAYELFLEQLPFEAETAAEILVMHLRTAPPPPREAWPDIPVALEQLLLAMLDKEPTNRPTMAGVARALEATRDELDRRRGAIAAASMPAISLTRITRPRLVSSAELAMTHDAGTGGIRRVPATVSRRWPIAIAAGALVAAMSAYVLLRGDSGTAAAAVVDAAPTSALVQPQPQPSPQPQPQLQLQLQPQPSPQPQPSLQPLPAAPQRSIHHAKKLAPHHVVHVDSNGTVDPYR